jgi:hypothetical protein
VTSVLQSPTKTGPTSGGGLSSASTQGTLQLDFGSMSPSGSDAKIESGSQPKLSVVRMTDGGNTTDIAYAAAKFNAASAAHNRMAISPISATSPPDATKVAAAEDAPDAEDLASALAQAQAQAQARLKATEEAEEDSPTQVFKALPKPETSLGEGDEAKFAARVAAADTRPTFYENVVEGTIKRKKIPGLGLSTTNTASTTPIAKYAPLPPSGGNANMTTTVGGGPSYPGDGEGTGTAGIIRGAAAQVTAESVATPVSSSGSLPPMDDNAPWNVKIVDIKSEFTCI